jgi:4-amino-4-deoxy-L-arabinose transferase-like glycosyltransferase
MKQLHNTIFRVAHIATAESSTLRYRPVLLRGPALIGCGLFKVLVKPLLDLKNPKFHRAVAIILAVLIACRTWMMTTLPHIDTSESRYAEISRKMLETSDWITPQFDYGIPFWAKPPLSMWMSGLGMNLFGVSEFGSRVFIFLSALAVLLIVYRAAKREGSSTSGLVAATILMGMPLFYYCSAAVMTDLVLALGTTMSMTGFRDAILGKSRSQGYLFFSGLAVGLLSKGPLVLVLAFPPLVGWALLTKNWRNAWQFLPWVTGTLLMLVIALPWYIAAEIKTPGFLDYFIIGEHWKRFFVRGWPGDLYGNAHSETPGTIWLHLLMVTFPWCLALFAIPRIGCISAGKAMLTDNGRILYWSLWALWPVVFFTPSRNIIATYPLPALPPLAILLAEIFQNHFTRESSRRFHPFHPALVFPTLGFYVVAAAISAFAPALLPKRTEREVVKAFHKECEAGDRLLYYGRRRYSIEFYSGGKVEQTESPEVLIEAIGAPERLFVAATERSFRQIPLNLQHRLILVLRREGRASSLYVER